MSSSMDLDDEGAARILTSLATPTNSTFGHFRHMSLDSPKASSFPRQSESKSGASRKSASQSSSRLSHNSSYQQTQQRRQPFDLFEALLRHEDVLLYLTTQHMQPQELFSLYCISRPFYIAVRARLTSFILSSARRWARLSHSRPSRDLPEPSTRINRVPVSSATSRSRSRRFNYTIEHQSAASQALSACGTEPTPPGIYSPHDVTTLLPFCNYLHLCTPDPIAVIAGPTSRQNAPKVVPTFR